MPQKGIPNSGIVITGTSGASPQLAPPGRAIFYTEELPAVWVETTGALCSPPVPKISTVDMMDGIGLTQWTGQDPYTMSVGVRIDGFPNHNVEDDIKALEALGEVQPGRSEPPIVWLGGAVPGPHPNLRWRIVSFGDPQIDWLPSGDRCRYVTTVSLVQRVTDRVLQQRIKATSGSKGLKARSTTVRSGEDYLYEVARRIYKDPSRAADLATANNLHLGKKLSPGLALRYP